MLCLALLSLSKKSGCGIPQPSPCNADENIQKMQYNRTTARNQGLNQLEAQKIGCRIKERKKNRIFTCRSRAYYISAGQKLEPKQAMLQSSNKTKNNNSTNKTKNNCAKTSATEQNFLSGMNGYLTKYTERLQKEEEKAAEVNIFYHSWINHQGKVYLRNWEEFVV